MQKKWHKYIYKLVDRKEINLAKNGVISLSRPIFEFMGSEGKIISFAQRIYKRYIKQGTKIMPSKTDLEEIKEWIGIYKKTYGADFDEGSINSESMIMFCGIIQAYCGYFTNINLFKKNKLKKYLRRNNFFNKTAVIRLKIDVFKHNHWRTHDLDSPFVQFYGDSDNLRDFNGFTHLINVIYTKHFDDYNYLLRQYNKHELRESSNWFRYINLDFKWQKERRILFLLRSLEKNSWRSGCDNIYNSNICIDSFEKLVFRNIVNAIDYCVKSPRYLFLNVGDNVALKTYDDILN